MTKPDDKRVPAYKLPRIFVDSNAISCRTMNAAERTERCIELLAECRALERSLGQGHPADTNAACERIIEIDNEFDCLLTELEVEVKRG